MFLGFYILVFLGVVFAWVAGYSIYRISKHTFDKFEKENKENEKL